MRLSQLLAGLPLAGLAVHGAADPVIERVIEDSRQARAGDMFVARSGVRADGGRFVADAVARGVVAVVAERGTLEEARLPAGVVGVEVAHAAAALGYLAHRMAGDAAASLRLLAVTGTNGKTTTTYLVRAGLAAAQQRCGLVGTVQTDDGAVVLESSMTTPGPIELADLFARMRRNGLSYAVLEASSHSLHQRRLAGLGFAVGMFSNLTGDHLDYHGTMENYAAAKAMLFEGLAPSAYAVVNADDAWSDRMVQSCKARVWRYGVAGGPRRGGAGKTPDYMGHIVRMDAGGMHLKIEHPFGAGVDLQTGFVGRHNAYNLLCALGGLCAVGVDVRTAVAGLERLDCVPGRLEPVIVPGYRRAEMAFQVFVDYAHTHDALENVLTAIRPWTQGRIICVFGCGGDRDVTKRPKMAAVAEKLADEVIVTSDNPRTEDPAKIIEMILDGFSQRHRARVVAQRREAIAAAIGLARPGDVVLIAGKGHENYQIVGTTKLPFDDVAEAQAALRLRRAGMVEV
ncbi:MAG: UDP-N-acetylmuramoyl-L-alanyl-D-glutamate--2,6-diaminopimelate ligase [Phycisphaerales bacterium]|nr:UDP-N-acetylmuramoyl-L-alanyl-D-glutamate--2,6-diaminopimelate ligase [Phycisphaerales bacterium]